jgi:hypothetical protein
MSQIGASARHIKEKGLIRAWSMSWLLNETNFIKLLTFYRKKGGILGTFGITDRGYVPHRYRTIPLYEYGCYLENVNDYIEIGYLIHCESDPFINNIDDYIQTDYFTDCEPIGYLINCGDDFILKNTNVLVDDGLYTKINARFQEDSFKYQKRLDGFYQCTADFVEVKE